MPLPGERTHAQSRAFGPRACVVSLVSASAPRYRIDFDGRRQRARGSPQSLRPRGSRRALAIPLPIFSMAAEHGRSVGTEPRNRATLAPPSEYALTFSLSLCLEERQREVLRNPDSSTALAHAIELVRGLRHVLSRDPSGCHGRLRGFAPGAVARLFDSPPIGGVATSRRVCPALPPCASISRLGPVH